MRPDGARAPVHMMARDEPLAPTHTTSPGRSPPHASVPSGRGPAEVTAPAPEAGQPVDSAEAAIAQPRVRQLEDTLEEIG